MPSPRPIIVTTFCSKIDSDQTCATTLANPSETPIASIPPAIGKQRRGQRAERHEQQHQRHGQRVQFGALCVGGAGATQVGVERGLAGPAERDARVVASHAALEAARRFAQRLESRIGVRPLQSDDDEGRVAAGVGGHERLPAVEVREHARHARRRTRARRRARRAPFRRPPKSATADRWRRAPPSGRRESESVVRAGCPPSPTRFRRSAPRRSEPTRWFAPPGRARHRRRSTPRGSPCGVVR